MPWIYIFKHMRESFTNAKYVRTTQLNLKQLFHFISVFTIQILLKFVIGILYKTLSAKSNNVAHLKSANCMILAWNFLVSCSIKIVPENKRAFKDKSQTSSENAYLLSATYL